MKKYWPVFGAVGLLILVAGLLFFRSAAGTGGSFFYPIDDAYIHMAIAKNIATHGVWGVTPYEFSPASSSLAWPLILAAVYRVFGVREIVPLLLNMLLAALLLGILPRRTAISSMGKSPAAVFCMLAAAFFLAPMPALVFGGMEHLLFIVIMVFFLEEAVSQITGGDASPGGQARLALLASALVVTRYEGFFLVIPVCVLLLLRKKPAAASLSAAASFLPVGIFGLFSVWHGWYFLPNPVLLKCGVAHLDSLADAANLAGLKCCRQLIGNPHVLSMAATAAALFFLRFRRNGTAWEKGQVFTGLFLTAALLHMQFARAGLLWFYRYEAYLVVLFLSSVLPEAVSFIRSSALGARRAAVLLPAVLSCVLLAARGYPALTDIPALSRQIYGQNYHMARFLQTYYQGKTVAVGDIGVVTFYDDIRLFDLNGLASKESGQAVLSRDYAVDGLFRAAQKKNVSVAIVYKEWPMPPEWAAAGEWTIPGRFICFDTTVVVYAVEPAGETLLKERLSEFAARLPSGIPMRVFR